MPKTVHNLFVNWVKLNVKNVFKIVGISHTCIGSFINQWNNLLYTLPDHHLPTLLIHSHKTIIISIRKQVIPIIHSAYNNQYERNFIKTSNRGRFV